MLRSVAPKLMNSTIMLKHSEAQTEYLDELDATKMKFEIKERTLIDAIDIANRRALGL